MPEIREILVYVGEDGKRKMCLDTPANRERLSSKGIKFEAAKKEVPSGKIIKKEDQE